MGGPTVLDRVATHPERLHAHGVVLPNELSFEDWKAIGERITRIHSGSRWALGDWLVYGEMRADYLNFYETAGEITGLGYSALRQTATLARQYEPHARRLNTIWSIYREALRLARHSRMEHLRRAAEFRWTIEQFREHVEDVLTIAQTGCLPPPRERKGATSRSAAQTRTKRTPKLIACPICGHEWSPA